MRPRSLSGPYTIPYSVPYSCMLGPVHGPRVERRSPRLKRAPPLRFPALHDAPQRALASRTTLNDGRPRGQGHSSSFRTPEG
eukprot:2256818-Prymnesium_polylepis.1